MIADIAAVSLDYLLVRWAGETYPVPRIPFQSLRWVIHWLAATFAITAGMRSLLQSTVKRYGIPVYGMYLVVAGGTAASPISLLVVALLCGCLP